MSIAKKIQAHSNAGEPILLVYNSGINLLKALYACFFTGRMAVISHIPRDEKHAARIQLVIKDANPKLGLTEQRYLC